MLEILANNGTNYSDFDTLTLNSRPVYVGLYAIAAMD